MSKNVAKIRKSQEISKNPKKSLFSKKSQNIEEEKKNSPKKNRKKMLSSYFSNIMRTRFDQSSPVQPVSESRRGSPEPDGGGRTDGQRKYLCLINIYFTCADCFSKTESLKISSATWKFEELPSKQYLKLSNLGGNI